MEIKSFAECLKDINWLTIIIIIVLSTAIELVISLSNGKKLHNELMKELQGIKETQSKITITEKKLNEIKFLVERIKKVK